MAAHYRHTTSSSCLVPLSAALTLPPKCLCTRSRTHHHCGTLEWALLHNVLAMLILVSMPHCVDVQRVTLSLSPGYYYIWLYLLLHWCCLLWSCNKTTSKRGWSEFGNRMFPKHEMVTYNDAQWCHNVKKKHVHFFSMTVAKSKRACTVFLFHKTKASEKFSSISFLSFPPLQYSAW